MTTSLMLIRGLSALGLLGLLPGCQSSSGSTPIAPATLNTAPPAISEALTLPDGVAEIGTYTLTINPAALSAELAPVREAVALGDVYNEVGVTRALKDRAAFRVDAVRHVADSVYGVTVSATHPFSLETRPDLSVFNLKVHVVTEGADEFGPGLITNAGFLTNADGYSTIWDLAAEKSLPTTASLHPYRVLSEDISRPDPFDPFAPSGFNVWAPESVATQELLLDLPVASVQQIRLFLTCDYGQSAIRETRDDPQYELPRFAGKAPWRVAVTEIENNLASNAPTSFVRVGVDVWDWGHFAGLGTDILQVSANSAALGTEDVVDITPSALADPLNVELSLANTAGAAEGTYWGLITVEDAAVDGTALADDLVTPFTVPLYNTYQVFAFAVGPAIEGAPTAVISEPCENITAFPAGIEVAFSGLGSFDAATPAELLIYEWDIDYQGDPGGFMADRTGRDITYTPQANNDGPLVVALKVTDEDELFNIATCTLYVVTVPGGPFADRVNLTMSPDRKEDLGRSQTGFDRNHMTIDAEGNLHLFSLTEFFDTEVTTYNFTTMEATGPDKLYETQYLYSVPIARTAPDGTVHLLYMAADRFDDNGYDKPSIGWRIYDPVLRTVSDETIVAEYFTPNPQAPTSNIPHMQGVSFDIAADGTMVAIYEEWWADSIPGNKETSYAANMFYIRGEANTWEAPTVVPWTTFTSYGDPLTSAGWKRARPDLRVSDDGMFHCVYLYNPDEDLDGPLPMWHRTYEFATDTWNDPIVALDTTENKSYAQVQVVPAPGGGLVLTYQEFVSEIFFARYDKGSNAWSRPATIADETNTGGIHWVNLPTAEVTPDGTVWVAFQALNPAPFDDLEEFYYTWFDIDATSDDVFNAPKVPLVPCIGPEGQREPQMIIDPDAERLIIVYEDPEDVEENDLWLATKGLPR